MKLLDKKVIDSQKALERKIEIDEGVKLAKKVDTLRETIATEEKRLADFRIESLKTIQTEIRSYTDKRDTLANEIKSLEKIRIELQKPLDKEWDRVNKTREQVELEKAEIAQKLEAVDSQIKTQKTKLNNLELAETKIEILRKLKEDELNEAKLLKKETKAIRDKFKKDFEEQTNKLEKRKQEVIALEMELSSQARGIINRQELLDRRESDLNLQERAIKDKYETLLRTQNYVRKRKQR